MITISNIHHFDCTIADIAIINIQGYAVQALAKFARKTIRLYEQEPLHYRVRRLGEYLRRWQGWMVGDGDGCGLTERGHQKKPTYWDTVK